MRFTELCYKIGNQCVVSDNGPQYTSTRYAKFAKDYGFLHFTSSPYHPRGNGEAERAVQTVKTLLKKADDPYKALLAYRSTPLEVGFSPSELLMCRKLRTTVPMSRDLRKPRVPDLTLVGRRDEKLKARQKENFDTRHGVKELAKMNPGDTVWIPDRNQAGEVTEQTSQRSYVVSTPEGIYRRNRVHLIPYPARETQEKTEPCSRNYCDYRQQPCSRDYRNRDCNYRDAKDQIKDWKFTPTH